MILAASKDARWVEDEKQESQQVAESDNQGSEVTEEKDRGRDMAAGAKQVQNAMGKMMAVAASSLEPPQ